jgi:rRNA maturation protein Nop10
MPLPTSLSQPVLGKCHDVYCATPLTDKDYSLGLCPECGAVLHYPKPGAEKIEKKFVLGENKRRPNL